MSDPQFERLISEIQHARAAYDAGAMEKYRAIMRLVGSLAYANAAERSPNAPVPEVVASGGTPSAPLQ